MDVCGTCPRVAEEPDQTTYYVAARYDDERVAERTYFRLQNFIRRDDLNLNLSAFRFLLRGEWTVAVIGENPGEEIGRRLERALARGERIDLDARALQFLLDRRAIGTEQGDWVERHYRPGQEFDFNR